MQRPFSRNKAEYRLMVRMVCLVLAVFTLVLYWPVRNYEFNNYDDAQYLTENPSVQNGLTFEAISWAFTTGYASNWHPLTWLSHLIDVQLFGFNAGAHHLINVVFHITNTLLLFLVLQRWTGALLRPALVAALFAWHPSHVESVAWVAERKDVLSTCFWLLTMLTYGEYVNASRNASPQDSPKPRTARRYYLLALVLFALGLLAKPMLVSLPLILLLLDYWPLRRIQPPFATVNILPLIREKIPFFVLTVASCAITFLVQRHGQAVQSLDNLGLGDRLANAVVAYARYLGKLFWPADLAVLYPYSRHLPLLSVVWAGILLLAICMVVVRLAKSHPPLLVGWLWFVITLVPVIGIVQVGEQSMADRYTYVPSIGLFLAIAWEVPRLLDGLIGKLRHSRSGLPGPSPGPKSDDALEDVYATARVSAMVQAVTVTPVLIACFFTAAHQLRFWENSIALFTRAIQVTANNPIAECNLGLAYAARGQTNEAILHEQAALRLYPNYAEAECNLGMLLDGQGKWEEATAHLHAALKSRPQYDKAHYNLGLVYFHQGRLDEAMVEFRSTIGINPRHDKAHVNLGIVLAQQGRFEEAIGNYRQALALAPNNPHAHNALGRALEAENKLSEAAAHYSAAIAAKPDFVEAHENLGVVLTLGNRFPEAEDQFAQALKLQPGSASVHYNLGNAYLRQNKLRAAADEYSEAVRLQPDYFEAHFNLALACTQLGQTAAAIKHYREVLRLKPQWLPALEKLAWLLATDPEPKLRDAPEALRLATLAVRLAPDDPSSWDAQAAALAEAGQYPEAVTAATKALELATVRQKDLAQKIQARLQLYQSGTPFHEPTSR